MFPDINTHYLFDDDLGIYIKISHEALLTITCGLLRFTKDVRLYCHEYVRKVVNNLLISANSLIGSPR
jgi:hypothetical protein